MGLGVNGSTVGLWVNRHSCPRSCFRRAGLGQHLWTPHWPTPARAAVAHARRWAI